MESHTRNFGELKEKKFEDEGVETATSKEQVKTNFIKVLRFYLHSHDDNFR